MPEVADPAEWSRRLRLVWSAEGREQARTIENLVRFGRAADNDIVINEDGVSRYHCRIFVDAGRVLLEDLGSTNGVSHNGQPITSAVELRLNDVIRIGSTVLRLTVAPRAPDRDAASSVAGRHPADDLAGTAPGSPAAWLEQPSGAHHELEAETLIGRGSRNDVQLDDHTVSRYHALIRAAGGHYVLSDLGSSNGTFVNGVLVQAPHSLRSGDRVRIGSAELVFRADEALPPGSLVAAPASSTGQWQTSHFNVYFETGSFAQGQLTSVGDRLESAYVVILELLGLTVAPTTEPSITVVLADVLPNPWQPGMTLLSGGYADSQRREIRAVYRADSPGTRLEQLLLQLLLDGVASEARALPVSRPALVAGLETLVLVRLSGSEVSEQVTPTLVEAKERGALPSIGTLLASSEPAVDMSAAAVAGFVDYLRQQYGPEAWRDFLVGLVAATLDEAARRAFGRSIAQVEKAWRKTLRPVPLGGGVKFLQVAGRYLWPHRLRVAEIVFYIILSVAFGIGLARSQGILLDEVLLTGDREALILLMATLVGAFALISLASLRESYVTAYVSESVLRELRLRMFDLVQRLHPGFFQKIDTGDILSRMTSDLAAIEYGLTGALAQGLQLVLTLVAALVVIFVQDWKLACLALVSTPLFYLVGRYLGPAAARASLERQEDLAKATSTLHENLGAQQIVKAFGLERTVTEQFATELGTLFRSSIRLTFLSGLAGLATNSIATVIQLIVLGVGAWLVTGGDLTAGTLFAFLALMSQIIGPLASISTLFQIIQQASGAMERVEELLRSEPAIVERPDARQLRSLSDAIRLEHVTFGYNPGETILHDLTLTIPAGAKVALVGPSGCGKSSVLNLLMRFYDPELGRVTFDGVDLRDAALSSARAQIGIVLQDNVLFNTSLRENIRLGNLAATDTDVEAAAKIAEIHDLAVGLPEGYDTGVGERGSRLSGGQRQRVAIARAIIRNPSLLLLDEATSALDPHTEAAINATLEEVARGRTTISVTHRLASVVNADQIYVLDQGRLVEQGTHGELVRRSGLYARLWQEQSGFIPGAAQFVGVEASRLQSISLFARLDAGLLAAIATRFTLERREAGETIVVAGATGDRFYVIDRGQADVLAIDAMGRQRRLATLGDGDYFGEIALLYDVPRTATVRARTAVQLYSLTKADFDTMLASVPGLQAQLERSYGERTPAGAVG
ncbi:MAG: FHA domain-containing protein [Chloroflexi bacterium]|nr:FHA domain-containing protein [Chloroflexota bacterium]